MNSPEQICNCGHRAAFCHKENAQTWCGATHSERMERQRDRLRDAGEALARAAGDAARVLSPREPKGMKSDVLRRLGEAQAAWKRAAA